uniref:Palmitoyltransferase n=1 Tax=Trepomonas sp. PC1 TaxID=1076344 RepID=A0A146KG56_9EUKA|eukprot:JAP94456.1 DHHC zinc finger domain-containing protein [Trepomonas sp. PC1]
MCTLCASAQETTGKRRFFERLMKLIPIKLQTPFKNFLQRYQQGKSYAFAIFIVAICLGSVQIYAFCRDPKTFYVQVARRTKKVQLQLKFDFAKVMLLHAWEAFTYFLVFFKSPFTSVQQKSDSLLNLPNRQKVCKACRHSVTKFDHHCIWISNCVAGGNFLPFLLFLLSTIVVPLLLLKINYNTLKNLYLENQTVFQGVRQFISASFESLTPIWAQNLVFVAISLSMTPFFVGLFINLLKNQTTFEKLKLQKIILTIKNGQKRVLEDQLIDGKDEDINLSVKKLRKRNVWDVGFLGNLAEAVKMTVK